MLALSAGFTWSIVDDYGARAIIPVGVTVDGESLGGLGLDQARELIGRTVATPLLQTVHVVYDGKTFDLDPKTSLAIDVDLMLEEALHPSRQATIAERALRRYADRTVDVEIEPVLSVDGAPLEGWIDDVASRIDTPAVDATVTIDADGAVVMSSSAKGRAVDRAAALAAITKALLAGEKTAELPVRVVGPKVTDKTLGKTIVVDLSERRLYLYDGLELEKKFGVAVGAPSFPTPRGTWEIVQKRYRPTWSNPGSAWAKDMPKSIPPGSGNPLGTRAMNLNASGIRIHGTSKDYSIGTAASHGCMRMHRWDIEDLYERVEVGTRVLIVS
ncbi:MAG: L,D-transpeptidase family protein [Actinomycetota bacterium]|nr:L,D-transpeptidase family protein [Actinomycetota bacterium]